MKIVYVCNEFPNLTKNFGGIAIVFEKEIAFLKSNGFDVELILVTGDSRFDFNEFSNIKIVTFPTKGIMKGLRGRFNLVSFINRHYNKDDIVVTADYLGLLPLKIRSKKVVQLHGSLTVNARKQNKKVGIVTYVLEYLNLFTATKIRSVSISILNDTKVAFPLCLKTKLKVIYNGIKVESNNFHKYSNSLHVIYIGKLSKLKGADFLGNIINGVHRQMKDVNFTIIGHDEKKNGSSEREKINSNLIYKDKVRFIERLTNAEILEHISESKLLILPSITESLGMVVIEAFSNRIPAVAFKVGGLEEVIDNGLNGFLIEPFDIDEFVDKINQILNMEQEKYNTFCELAYAKYLHYFNLENTMKDLINFYEIDPKRNEN